MVTGVGEVTRELAMASLDALLLRHRVIATNIAHHDSEGFRPMRLAFEAHLAPLREALANGASDNELRTLLQQAKAQVDLVPAPGDGTVRLDEEMSELAKNTLHYQALLTAMGKLGSLKRLVIEGGNR